MLISVLAAAAMFAAPESASSGESARIAAEAKPEMKRVCETIHLSGTNLPKRNCRNVPVRAATKPGEPAETAAPKGQAQPE